MAIRKKGDWLVYSKLAGTPAFRLVLANCTRKHAESVCEGLVYDRAWPDDVFLVLIRSVADVEPAPIGDPVPFIPKENHVG